MPSIADSQRNRSFANGDEVVADGTDARKPDDGGPSAPPNMARSAHSSHGGDNRRDFLCGSSLLLASALPAGKRSATPSLKIGLIGCGRSGVVLASEALQHRSANVAITALADAFPDRLQQATRTLKGRFGAQFQVDSRSRHVGPQSYRNLLERDLDLVIIATPVALRPALTDAVLASGMHVYVEQPVAADLPGAMHMLQLASASRGDGVTDRASLAIGSQLDFSSRFANVAEQLETRAWQETLGQIIAIESETVSRPARVPSEKQLRLPKRFVFNPSTFEADIESLSDEIRYRNWRLCPSLAGDGTLLHRTALHQLLSGMLHTVPASASVISHVEYGSGREGFAHCLDSRVRYRLLRDSFQPAQPESRPSWLGEPQIDSVDQIELVSRHRVQVGSNVNALKLRLVGERGRCDVAAGLLYDQHGRCTGKVPRQQPPRAAKLHAAIDRVHALSSGEVNVPSLDACEQVGHLISALMGQLASDRGSQQLRPNV